MAGQPTQDKGGRAWIGRQSPFLAAIYYSVAIAATVLAVTTAVVNYANRSDKSGIVRPAQALGGWLPLPNNIVQLLLDYRWPILGLCAAIVVSAVVLRIRTLRRKLASIAVVDEIWRLHAGILEEIRTFPRNGDVSALTGEIDQFLTHSLNKISVLFTSYTGRPVHVSLKLLDGENKRIRTVSRDQLSAENRGGIDEAMEWYPFADNTAFDQILTNPGSAHYLENHLRFRAMIGKYKNARPDWRKYYRACLVVPITLATHAVAINEKTVWGFLTVDNRGGGFDTTCGCPLLQSFGRMYYSLLGELSLIPVGATIPTRGTAAGRAPVP